MSSTDTPLRRFTVLHHTGIDQPHYDFLFETAEGSQLTTFRLHTWPAFENQPARKLRDHRRAYLDYAGPVSGDRGRVDRVDEGTVRVSEIGAAGWELSQADGSPFIRFEPLRDGEEDEWTLLYMGSVGA